MLLEKIAHKRWPRVFLSAMQDPISGLEIYWPDFSASSAIVDISLAGILIPAQGFLSKVKQGQAFTAVLKISGQNDPQTLSLKLEKISADCLGFSFDSLTLAGRLKIDQLIKDSIVGANLKIVDSKCLPPQAWCEIWFHGPFDTNILIWHKENGIDLKKAIFEYDGLLLIYNEGYIEVSKSQTTVDITKGYAHPWLEKSPNKVSLGASYLSRLITVLLNTHDPNHKLNAVIGVIQNLRGH